ncbi:MAG: O-antigen ligase family protein [Bacillota bacterium]
MKLVPLSFVLSLCLSTIVIITPQFIHNDLFSTAFLLLLIMLVGYVNLCIIFDPLKLFIFAGVMLGTIGTKLHIGKYEDYIGGVGASHFFLGIPHIALIFGLISIVVHGMKYPERKISFSKLNKMDLAIILFIFISCLSAIIAPFKAASMNQFNFYFTLLIVYLLWSRIASFFTKKEGVGLFIKALSVAVVFEITISAIQLVKGSAIGLVYLGEGDVTQRVGVPFVMINGTMGHPGPLSLFLTFVACIIFPFILKKKNYFYLFIFLLSFIGIVMTFSRTNLIVACAILFFEFIILNVKKVSFSKGKLFLMILSVSIFIATFGSLVIARFTSLESSNDPQVENRLVHFQLAYEYIKEKPFIGHGLNNWSYVNHQNKLMNVGSFFYDNPVHNMYLLLWFEGGILLLGTFVGVMFIAIRILIKKFSRGEPLFEVGLLGAICTALLYGFTGWGLFNGDQLLYIVFIVLAFVKVDFSDEKSMVK